MRPSRRNPFSSPLTLGLTLSVLSGAIFLADTLTDLEIAVPVLYVVVILISVASERPRIVGRVGVGCGILTIMSFPLSQGGALESGLANCALSLVAIGATTVLAIKMEAASRARRQASADLARISRVMIVGELTSSIVHEVSQPFAAIVANSNAALRWLSRSPPQEDEARRAIAQVAENADRAGAVIARVRRLTRRLPASDDDIALNETIAGAATILADQLREHRVVLRLDLAGDLPLVKGDQVQLQQVLLNLMLNGIEAMVPLDPSARELTIRSWQRGRQVSVSVRDRGIGVAPEDAARISEAFFTTKPAGMGVGLAISRSIIEVHGGTIDIGPHPPRGAMFGFTLPAHPSAKIGP